jgi:hypothetical protein
MGGRGSGGRTAGAGDPVTARATVRRGEVTYTGALGATLARMIFPAGEMAEGLAAAADGDDAAGRIARALESVNAMYLAGMTATPDGMAPKSTAGDGSTVHALALLTLERQSGPIEGTRE